jgi:hypothetical protein
LTEEATSDSVPDPIYPDKGIRDADLKSVNDRKDTYHEVVEFADTLGAPIVHALRGKPFNPYDVGMTGLIGFSSGYHASSARRHRPVGGQDKLKNSALRLVLGNPYAAAMCLDNRAANRQTHSHTI